MEIVKDRYGEIGARFIQGDITDPKIIEQAFQELGGKKIDIALCIMVIEFLNDKQLKKFLKNVKSILSDKGVLIVVTTHPDRYENKYGPRGEGPVRTQHPWGGEPFTNFYRKSETLKKIFEAAGFEVSLIDLEMPEEYTTEFGGEFNTYGAPARLGILAKSLSPNPPS